VQPSTILDGIETAALLIWELNPYTSSFGNLLLLDKPEAPLRQQVQTLEA
jgi:hypothetical protein